MTDDTRPDELTHEIKIAVGPNEKGLKDAALGAQKDAGKHREQAPDPAPARARRTKGG